MQVKKQQLELDMEQQTGSKLGKEYIRVVYYHPAYLTYMQSMSRKIPGCMNHKLRIKITGENNNNIRYADDTLMTEKEEELKSFLMRVKEESEKTSLKLNIQKTKIMASSSITSRQIAEEKETVVDLIFLGSSWGPVDGDCSHEIKTLAPCKESYDRPRQHIKKQRHNFADKGPYSQSYGFSSSHIGM